jgi:hypothetical protein
LSLLLFDASLQNGCAIAVSSEACAPVRFAAEELQRYLSTATGGKFPIVESIDGDQLGFAIGRKGKSLLAAPPELTEDGYIMKTVGQQIVLLGGSPRATLYAVYHFLEKYLGFRWLEPGDDAVPSLSKIELGNIDDLEEPAYSFRSILNFPYTTEQMIKEVDWMAKVRLNWAHPAPNDPHKWQDSHPYETVMPEVFKRGISVMWGGHTFHTWIPNDVYLETHPEFFALINCERGNQANFKGSLCLSNPQLAPEVAKNMLRFADENPGIDVLDLWVNDCQDWCECDNCREMEGEADYTMFPDAFCSADRPLKSRAYFTFVNAVARLVAASNPKLRISPLAYYLTYEPPHDLKLEPNVFIGFTNFARSWQTPLMTGEHPGNVASDATIRKWRGITENLFIYEYYAVPGMFNAFTGALTNLDVMAKELKYYPSIGIRQISSEAGADLNWRTLVIYAYARLVWNPEEPYEAILEDFCRHAYGNMAEQMIEFWRYQEGREPLATRCKKNLERLHNIKQMTTDEKILARLGRLEFFQNQPDPIPNWPENMD